MSLALNEIQGQCLPKQRPCKQSLSQAWRRRWGSATVLIKIRLWLQSTHLQAEGFLLPCWWGRSCFLNKDNVHVLLRATCVPDFLTGIVRSAEAPAVAVTSRPGT